MKNLWDIILVNKRFVLGVIGGLVLVGMVLFIALGGFGSNIDSLLKEGRIEEAIAEYARQMETKPTAVTAGRMLDLATKSGKRPLVFKVLQEHIHPWLEVKGVKEEFVRGVKWYIPRGNLRDEGLLWLLDEILKIDSSKDLNADLAKVYLLEGNPREQVRYGNLLFSSWELDQPARDHYQQALADLLTGFPLVQGVVPEMVDVSGVPVAVADLSGLELVPEYLKLWLQCWQGDPNQEFVTSLNSLAGSDPLNIYWRLRAVALARGLEKDWQNPLGLDVAEEIEEVFNHLLTQEQEELLAQLREKLNPADKSQAYAFVRLVARPKLDQNWGLVALEALLAAAGAKVPPFTPETLFFMDIPNLSLDAEAKILLEKLGQDYSEDKTFLQLLKHIQTPAGDSLNLLRKMEFPQWGVIELSPTEPAFLHQDYNQVCNTGAAVTLVNIKTWKTTDLGHCQAVWSPKGDRLVTMEFLAEGIRLRIMSSEGALLDQFTLTNIPLSQTYTEDNQTVTYYATIRWAQPNTLVIGYEDDGEYFYEEFPGRDKLVAYQVDLETKAVTQVLQKDLPSRWLYLSGLNLYHGYQQGLFDETGTKVGDSLGSQKRVEFSSEASEIYLDEGKLMFKNRQGTKLLIEGEFSYHIPWVARLGEQVYLASYYNLYSLNPGTGDFNPVQSTLWHENIPVIQKKDPEGRNPGNLMINWQEYCDCHDDEEILWEVDKRSIPFLFFNSARFTVFKTGSRYLVILQRVQGSYFVGEVFVLEFR